VMQFNERGRAYRYLQIITNFNSDRKTNYVTEINLSEDGLFCSPGSTTSCNGGGTRACNASGSAYGKCVPKVVPVSNTCFAGRAGDRCIINGVWRKPSFHGGR
jgi:hypothetical protein